MEKKVVRLPANGNNNPRPTSQTPISNPKSNSVNQQPYYRSESIKGKGFTVRHDFHQKSSGPVDRNFRSRGHDRSSLQRKQPKNRQSDEVMLEANNSCATERNVEKRSKHGKSANHLLNFSYAPLARQDGGSGRPPSSKPGWKSGKYKTPILTKEQFLQANCQFVVKNEHAYKFAAYISQQDIMVPWEDIEQIRIHDEQLPMCPICLDVPVAARITKCAHIYCWPCMLHYLSLSERAWAKCPMCFDAVESKDLKSVAVVVAEKYNVGDEVTFKLMKRERDSMYVRPCDSWEIGGSGKLYDVNATEEDVKYSKILTASVNDILNQLEKERRQLQNLLTQNEPESLEASFINVALEALTAKGSALSPPVNKQRASPPIPEENNSQEPVDIVNALKTKAAPQLKTVAYVDAFDDEVTEEQSAAHNSDAQEASDQNSSVVDPAEKPANVESSPERMRSSNSVSSLDSSGGADAAEQVAADLTLPPTGTQHSTSYSLHGDTKSQRRTEVYYFYQSADGRNVFLHSINTRILAAQYGSLELAPHTLTGTIVESEANSMSLDLRKRLKYLSHLPIHSQFTVCEITLRPPVVSSAVLSHFTDELAHRKKVRSRRIRTENRQLNRALAEERRQMGKYPDMSLALDSNKHFPVSVADTAVATEEGPPVGSNNCEIPSAADLQQCSAPLSTPLSFAQAMRGSASGIEKVAWPRVQGSSNPPIRSRSTATSGIGDMSDDSTSAPTFRDSFTADFDRLLSDLSADSGKTTNKCDQDAAKGGKAGKKKGKKQQLVLFSTSGQRSNN